jgi:molecular chaperone DnaK (HSP70)
VVTPEQVGTEVLKHLLALTRDYLGHSQVNKAVIAVPAKFTAIQRQATAEAYRQAGLKVVRVMEEPTAAAVAYRLHKRTDIHHILVYDFGGGTLDVSLLYVGGNDVDDNDVDNACSLSV